MPYPVECFLEINEDVVYVLLMLAVLFTHNSQVEYLFCSSSFLAKAWLFFSDDLFCLGYELVQDDFQHYFAGMAYEAYRAIVLALL